MFLRFLALCLACLCLSMPAEAKKAKPQEGGEAVKEVKPPPNTVPLPLVRLAVRTDDNNNNNTYRALELEVWVVVAKEEDTSKVSSGKQKIIAALRERFLAYKVEAFTSAEHGGVDLVKSVVKATIEETLSNPPAVKEVLLRTMILR